MENSISRNQINKRPFNKIVLQLIALITMSIDHVAWLIFPNFSIEPLAIIMHIIGRITFPIFAFFIAEGYFYTSNKKKYLLRITIFALISHVPYMLQSSAFKEFGWLSLIPFATGNGIGRFLNQGSVLWSYAIGLIMLMANDSTKLKQWAKVVIVLLLCIASFPADWSCIGSLIILAIGSNRGKPIKQIIQSIIFLGFYIAIYCLFLDLVYGFIQLGTLLAIPLLFLYNGKKSSNATLNKVMKWVFYIYYPAHLLILGIIGLFV